MTDNELTKVIDRMERSAGNERERLEKDVTRELKKRREAFIKAFTRYHLDADGRLCGENILELVEPRTVRRAVGR